MTQATAITKEVLVMPSSFERSEFNFFGGYLTYGTRWEAIGERFVARFKHNRKRKGKFVTFLIKNFTPDEYFSRLGAGETPYGILRSKGFQG